VNLDGLDISILGPAFVAGLLVVSTHVPLGREVLARGIIFIDLAIAQIAGLGVVAADSAGWDAHGLGVQVVAAASALAGALVLHWTERRWGESQEALIGVAFVLAATGGILLLANNPHGGEHLKDLLAGQILWVGWPQIGSTAILYAALLAVWFGLRKPVGRLRFYLVFALAVTASVQLLGVYLVFASLILPALALRRHRSGGSLGHGYLIGVTGYALGLVLSALFDVPSGPVLVWALAATSLMAGWLARGRRTTPLEARA